MTPESGSEVVSADPGGYEHQSETRPHDSHRSISREYVAYYDNYLNRRCTTPRLEARYNESLHFIVNITSQPPFSLPASPH